MVRLTRLFFSAFCAIATATQGSTTESPALANSAAEGSTHLQATAGKSPDKKHEKDGNHHKNKENDKKRDKKTNDRNNQHKENHDNKDKGHDDHDKNRGHNDKKHRGHHGKPERFRWVDGGFGDFYRCPSSKAHCHNGNRKYLWDDHSKRCWIKYESGDECCYSHTQDGCHIFRKESINTC